MSSNPAQVSYDASAITRYSDTANWDLPTRVAVSILTQAGVVQGDPTGTYRAQDHLNRAEFMQIAMRLLPAPSGQIFMNCFPDVPSGTWYEEPVCRAKSLGIVRGNVDTSVSPDKWLFEPGRDVNYEEAVKVLDKIYALPATEINGNQWYVPFINAAHEKGIDLPGLIPGDKITRGEMAQLTANFYAYATGNLDVLRVAEGLSTSSASSTSSVSSTSSASSTSLSSPSSSSSTSAIYDQMTDRSVQPNILLLSQTTPILAGAKFFSNNEPLDVNSLTINLANPVSSIDSFLIYDGSGRYLGTASQVSGSKTAYKAPLASGVYSFGRRVDSTVYVRARLKGYDSGGVSGENVQISSVQLNGTGQWSDSTYTSSSSDVYPISETARGTITSVTNAGTSSQLISSGTDQLLGKFQFNAQTTDGQAKVKITQLILQANATNGVTLSNVQLRSGNNTTTSNCTVSGNTVTCASIPSDIGTVSGSATISVYGDVSISSGAVNPTLQLSINNGGNTASAGDVTWTDGTTTFTWLPLSSPIVRGTQFQ